MTSQLSIDYVKRKNTELFEKMKNKKIANVSKIQNYVPIYSKFFNLNSTNYNSINLNHNWYIHNINNSNKNNENVYNCSLKNTNNNKGSSQDIFIKMAPLLDPFKYLMGKYDIEDTSLFNLPNLDDSSVHNRMIAYNNSAYIDSFFSYLSSLLINEYNFLPNINFYGSFLGVKHDYKVNIYDDIEYLHKSDFFIKHKNIDFKIDEYDYLITDCDPDVIKKLKPLTINNDELEKDELITDELDVTIFDDIFKTDISDVKESTEPKILTLNDLKNTSLDVINLSSDKISSSDKLVINSLKSSSTCSSRLSYSSRDENDQDEDEDEDEDETVSHTSSWSEYSSSNESEEQLFATFSKFPVQIICMEKCDSTFDDLIMDDNMSHDTWFSALMQIIMILLTYQQAFSFTHNDLHTNNIMFNKTNKKFLYYCYKNTYYKVPTFGRIFKIIDFGRAIYTYNSTVFCSDSFKPGEDAATQYNTEPYFNKNKPRLDPNNSFDLCRLACSIYDYVVDDNVNNKNIHKEEPIVRLIYEWCKDDNNLNILYKNNGDERYPDFKLYKMIARCVHRHTPINQLSRPEFKTYEISKGDIPANIIEKHIINIDNIPSFSTIE